MFNFAMLLNLAANDVETPNLFPFPPSLHIGFSIAAFIFFAFRFLTNKKPYQLIMALAVPFSLTLWLSANRKWFYFIGFIEVVLLLAAWISSFFTKDKETSAEASTAEKTAETSSENE